jgi:hypothetical protein
MMGSLGGLWCWFAPPARLNPHKRTHEDVARTKPASFTPPGTRSKAKHQPRKKAGRHNTKRSR